MDGELNLFAYCNNNPVNYYNPDGEDAVSATAWAASMWWLLWADGPFPVGDILFSLGFVASTIAVVSWSGTESSVADTTYAASGQSKIEKSVSDSFSKIKETPNYRSSHELHHLVAKGARNAQYARAILEELGIGINSVYNLQLIKTGLHRRLHTDSYYGWANSVVISAYNAANGDRVKQSYNVMSALNIIRMYVLALNAAAPF